MQLTQATPCTPQAVLDTLAEGTHLPAESQQPEQLAGPHVVGVPHDGTTATKKPRTAPKDRA